MPVDILASSSGRLWKLGCREDKMFTKKHHKAIAEVIRLSNNTYQIVRGLSEFFKEDNKKFNTDEFLSNCGASLIYCHMIKKELKEKI